MSAKVAFTKVKPFLGFPSSNYTGKETVLSSKLRGIKLQSE